MSLDAFMPQGNSQLCSATTTPSTGFQVTGNITTVRIRTSALAFVAISVSSGVTCAIPSTSAAANGIPLNSASQEKFTVPPNAYLSFMTSAVAGALIYITPGAGI